MKLTLPKLFALISTVMVGVMLTLAVVLATLAIPIILMGHDVSWFAVNAILGGHQVEAVAVVVVAALFVIAFLTTLTQGTSDRLGDAGGHVYRRITPVSHDNGGLVKWMIKAMMTTIWARPKMVLG